MDEADRDARARLVEQIAELDDDLTVKFLEGDEITVEELKAGLRRAVIAQQGHPGFLRQLAARIKVFSPCWMR